MTETFDIAGYCRISVDEELDRDNVSIENQKAIIRDFVNRRFPGSSLTFYEDRDRSGYTFEQREGYQAMRKGLIRHQYDILVVKDFSRFSRRNSRGLVELEDLRDAGVRIISVGDNIDFPNDDDWLKIQFQFLINEMPVTDTSKKVKNVIRRRQADGKWLCAAPYGYIINRQKEFEIVPTEAEIVRQIFDLYNNQGWGYKKIANYLTEQGIPTPRMSEQMRKEAAGEPTSRKTKAAWAIVTVQGILDNDFYIGTFRQAKYTRAKINGKDVKRDEEEHIVIENHHQPIIDYRTFATTRALREKRSTANYRGVKKYDNVYSGFLFCGDCGSPMFAMSRRDLSAAYTCGTYHRRGRSGCSSHHIACSVCIMGRSAETDTANIRAGLCAYRGAHRHLGFFPESYHQPICVLTTFYISLRFFYLFAGQRLRVAQTDAWADLSNFLDSLHSQPEAKAIHTQTDQ